MKRDFAYAAAAIAAAFALTYGLATMRPDLPMTASQPYSTKTGRKPAKNEVVIMRVNGEPVTEREFYYLVGQMPEQQRALLASPEGRKQIAAELVKLKVLAQEGKKRGGENDPEAASRIDFLRANVIASYAVRDLVGEPDEQAIRAEYEKQKGRLSTVELSHILVRFDGHTPEQAMERANAIHARLRAGADFAATARDMSEDPGSAPNGGAIGEVGADQLPPEVMSLQPGQISAPIQSQAGIHIFKAGRRNTQPYEQVKPMLKESVQQQRALAELQKLESSAKVDYDPKFFSSSNLPRPPGGGS